MTGEPGTGVSSGRVRRRRAISKRLVRRAVPARLGELVAATGIFSTDIPKRDQAMPLTPDEPLDRIDEVENQGEEELQSFTDYVREKPIQAVVAAGVLGFVLAKLVF